MKNILVTGGAGFIGSHLCEKLLEQGNHIICLDNFFTGSRKNVEHLFDNREFELIRHDIIEPIILEVDQIYNLACPASPVHYQYNAIKTIKTNVLGVTNMLDLADSAKARILQASTSEVYGDGSQTRSFCYVDDLVRGMISLMNAENFMGPVNVGNDGEYTILDLAKMIIELTNSSSKLIFKPLPSDDPCQRKPDLSLAKEKLEYAPTVNVKDGLLKTIEYFQNVLCL